jgi:hypothetical protein
MSRVKQRRFARPVNYFTREELCKPRNIGICKTLSVVEGDEPCQLKMQGDQSAQCTVQNTVNKHPTQIILFYSIFIDSRSLYREKIVVTKDFFLSTYRTDQNRFERRKNEFTG